MVIYGCGGGIGKPRSGAELGSGEDHGVGLPLVDAAANSKETQVQFLTPGRNDKAEKLLQGCQPFGKARLQVRILPASIKRNSNGNPTNFKRFFSCTGGGCYQINFKP